MSVITKENQYLLKDLKLRMKQEIMCLKQKITPIGEPLSVHRIEINCEDIDILKWLKEQSFETKLYWANREGEFEMGGLGVAQRITGTDHLNYEELFEFFSKGFNRFNPNIRFYGGMCFDPNNYDESWHAFGTYQFLIPQFEFVKTKEKTIFACNISYKNVESEYLTQLITQLDKINFKMNLGDEHLSQPINRADFPDEEQWKEIFDRLPASFQNGLLQKIVLARKSLFEFQSPMNAFLIKKKLKAMTPECYHFCFQAKPGHVFLGKVGSVNGLTEVFIA